MPAWVAAAGAEETAQIVAEMDSTPAPGDPPRAFSQIAAEMDSTPGPPVLNSPLSGPSTSTVGWIFDSVSDTTELPEDH